MRVVVEFCVLCTVAFAFPISTRFHIFFTVLTMGAGIFSTNGLTRVCHTNNVTFSSITQTISIAECSIRTSHTKFPFTSDFSKKMFNITIPSYKRKSINQQGSLSREIAMMVIDIIVHQQHQNFWNSYRIFLPLGVHSPQDSPQLFDIHASYSPMQ